MLWIEYSSTSQNRLFYTVSSSHLQYFQDKQSTKPNKIIENQLSIKKKKKDREVLPKYIPNEPTQHRFWGCVTKYFYDIVFPAHIGY